MHIKKLSILACLTLSLQAETLYQDKSGNYFVVDNQHIICTDKAKTTIKDPLTHEISNLKKEIISLRKELKTVKLSDATQTAPQKTKKDALTFDANIRTGYIYYKENNSTSTSSKATGGFIGFTTKDLLKGIKARVAFYGVEALDSQNSNDDFNMKAGGTTESYGFVGEAKIIAKFDDHEFHLGRQQLDMPHNDRDDIRMLPNLFEAYRYGYNEKFYITHLRAMAGWENGGDHTKFINVHQVLAITDENNQSIHKGISVVHFEDKSADESFEYSLYNYFIHEALNLIYVEASYTAELSKTLELKLSAQYDNYRDTNSFIMDGTAYTSFDSEVAGASIGLEAKELHLSFTLAANKVSGNNAPMGSLGGGPYFTSMENNTIDAVGTNDASAYLASLEYDASSLLEGLTLSYAYGAFASGDKSVDNFEQNYMISYEKEDELSVNLALSTVTNAPSTGSVDYTLFRAFIDIPLKK